MNEQLLQFIWKFRLFDRSDLTTTKGHRIDILHPGQQNTDSGADFQNARIRHGSVVWAGSVELHLNGNDWRKHRHHLDQAYNNVILHVVYEDGNINTVNERGEAIHVIELKNRIRPELLSRYEELKRRKGWIPCEKFFGEVNSFTLKHFAERLAVERLEIKVEQISNLLRESKNDWEQVMFVMLARYLGASINKEPFMRLAQSLPIRVWAKHRDDLMQLEALVFGQAGLLDGTGEDEYPQRLRKEYLYLKRLYSLKPLEKQEWKFLRLRPSNFPTIRLAQLAALMHREEKIFSQILDTEKAKKVQAIFDVDVSDYWQRHYVFDKVSKSVNTHLGSAMKNILIINAVAPVLFAYGKYKDDENCAERALKLLQNSAPEENAIIKKWKQLGQQPKDAFATQALLQLKNEYCDSFRCLDCAVGNSILK